MKNTFALIIALATTFACGMALSKYAPVGRTVPTVSRVLPLAHNQQFTNRFAVLQSIPTQELLSIAIECMTEEGYDESDMHESLSNALKK